MCKKVKKKKKKRNFKKGTKNQKVQYTIKTKIKWLTIKNKKFYK